MTELASRPPSVNLQIPNHIRPEHLARRAVVYVRQSTIAQVQNNRESRLRQYSLVDRLLAWGWAKESVEVIDEDQGRSGADSHHRPGFQRLVSEVALRKVGIIIGLETSRLARNNEDWQRLMNICEVVDTLIADAEGVYSLRHYNDRILLGMKGTVSEIELHVLRQRLNAGLANKAQRGELIFSVPVGYTVTEDEEKIEKNPDEAVQNAILTVYRRFQGTGSIYSTALALQEERFLFPNARDKKGRKGVNWVRPTFRRVLELLENPTYAGAYVYGRHTREATVTPEGLVTKRRVVKHGPQEWPVFLPDHHPGYISWDDFETIQKRIRANRRGYGSPGPVGEGPSLLVGILRCTLCGHAMTVTYSGAGHDVPRYSCGWQGDMRERRSCQTFGARPLEERVTTLLLSVLEPQTFETALRAEKDVEAERTRQIRRWDLEVERAEQAESRARRKFDEVEPGNRLVARSLEKQWEGALKSLEEARRTRELKLSHLPPP
ncbi:MAG: recombinase family protein, partial [Thermoplasmata archaeon]